MKKFLIIFFVIFVGVPVLIAAFGFWYVSRFTTEGPPPEAASETSRTIESGRLVGFNDQDSHAWLGIPFAAPPVDRLRWRAPQPVEPWTQTLRALEFGNSCVQSGLGSLSGSEDCLYLNVWSPVTADGSRPVMFFIHGGGNHLGEGGTPIYNGAKFAREHGVVVVTINYRLGPFGWLVHPGLNPESSSPEDRSGNYGTLDLIHALGWVRDNIEQFGGDPGNVTIFGESAGGFNVLSLMVSPLAEHLYHRAIVQSGGMTLIPMSEAGNYTDDAVPGHGVSSKELINRLLVSEERASDRTSAKALQVDMTDEEAGAYLRTRSAEQIMTAQSITWDVEPPGTPEGFVLGDGPPRQTPYIFGDGHVLPEGVQLNWLFADPDRYNVTPVILGSNRNETRLFTAFSEGYTSRVFGVPWRISDEKLYERDTGYGSDLWKADGVDELAILLRESQGNSVFAYRFDWDELRSLLTLNLSKLMGAAHAFELPFVFGNFDLVDKTLLSADGTARDALSGSMMSYWAEFARNGAPGRGGSGSELSWEPWSNAPDADRVLLMDTDADGGIRMSPLLVTRDSIRQTLMSDERFTEAERCTLAARLFPDTPLDDFEHCAAPESSLRVSTGNGPVEGIVFEDRARAWLGIPYAAPPIGELRWQSPQPPTGWHEPLSSTEPGPSCLQPRGEEILGQEDCLTLSVFASTVYPADPAPVMFWIHGGANYLGESGHYDGSRLAAEHGVIVVTINYRLGPFGWFHHPAVVANSDRGTGQFALLDMIAALGWVRDNIAAFGGDPDNVTLFGGSAGGQNVYALMLSPAAAGLFHKAIGQSGGFWNMSRAQAVNYVDDPVPGTPASANETINALLIDQGIAEDRESGRATLARWSPDQLESWLSGLPAEAILKPYINQSNLGYDLPSVVYDGVLLPEVSHREQLANGTQNKVPMILGGNRDEQKLYLFANPEFVEQHDDITRIIDPDRYSAFNRYYSDWWNFMAVDDLAPRVNNAVYAYRFDWDDGPTNPTDLASIIGAAHGLEIPFVFGNFGRGLYPMMFTQANRKGREALSGAMMSYWAQFAHTGDPGRGRRGILPEWDAWQANREKLLLDASGAQMASASIDGDKLLDELFEDPILSLVEKCVIYKDNTMYPRYDLESFNRRGCELPGLPTEKQLPE